MTAFSELFYPAPLTKAHLRNHFFDDTRKSVDFIAYLLILFKI